MDALFAERFLITGTRAECKVRNLPLTLVSVLPTRITDGTDKPECIVGLTLYCVTHYNNGVKTPIHVLVA